MKKKTDKILKLAGIIGGALLIVSIAAGFIGFLLGSEFLFNFGMSFLIFICPAYFVLFLIVFFIVAMIEEKEKK